MASRPIKLAATLGEKLRRARLGNRFRVADIYLQGWAALDTPERARAAVQVLVDAEWVRRVVAGGKRGDAGSAEYMVNPAICS